VKLPEKYIERMKTLLDKEYDDYMKSLDEKSVNGIRINTLKTDKGSFKNICNCQLENVKWCDEGFYCGENDKSGKSIFHHAGLFYIQEPSAMSAASVLPSGRGMRILDICAAPGGKTTQTAAKMGNSGLLFANDISSARAKAIVKNIELMGIKNCIVMSENPKNITDRFHNFFDCILIDAPCSGEGMFRRKADLIKSWNEEMLEFCEKTQREILDSAEKMLKKDGFIVYSTCTFSPEEDERVIEDFLDLHSNYELIEIGEKFGFEKGRPKWTKSQDEKFSRCRRIWPHKMKGEGHFIALMKKISGDTCFDYEKEQSDNDKRIEIFREFVSENLNVKLEGIFKIINNNIYLLPEDTPKLKGIRILRSGLLLGEFKKERFEPSQAFAMFLKKEEAKNSWDFSFDDERVIRYLKGETVEAETEKNGWCLVCAGGFPLGWAKAQNGRLKNKYQTGWRWE
jgi:NOL1/NOP2/sun family putative RNA methylase